MGDGERPGETNMTEESGGAKEAKRTSENFQQRNEQGAWKPKMAVSVLDTKKEKKLKKLPMDVIQSPDEDVVEEEEEPLLDGFRLQVDSEH